MLGTKTAIMPFVLLWVLTIFTWQSDMKLKKFLHIIENSPVFPVIHDSKRYE